MLVVEPMVVAEFIKHALGLMHTQPGRAVTLLGLYREPLNAAHHVHFEEHRREVAAFTDRAAGPPLAFESMTYTLLWESWDARRPPCPKRLTSTGTTIVPLASISSEDLLPSVRRVRPLHLAPRGSGIDHVEHLPDPSRVPLPSSRVAPRGPSGENYFGIYNLCGRGVL